MTPTIPRDSVAGQFYNDLRNLAKRNMRDPSEYYTLYALEGFLARLSRSTFNENLVLKGGVLVGAYSERRLTRDIDLSVTNLPNDMEACESLVRSIAAVDHEDGLVFDLDAIKGEVIRDESIYSGVRVYVSAHLASANLHFHVDMNFGDPIFPKPITTALPLLLGGHAEVLAYPLCMLLAEKIVTAIDRGIANTRWRDFSDIETIAKTQEVDGSELVAAIETVCIYRSTVPIPLSRVLEEMPQEAQPKWAIWRKKQRLENISPESFHELLLTITRFSDPAIEKRIRGLVWSPNDGVWR